MVYNNESHLEYEADVPLNVGDTFPAIRGNGPREGERVGTVTVTAVTEDGPTLSVHFWGSKGDPGG
jgi:hypothetical protein